MRPISAGVALMGNNLVPWNDMSLGIGYEIETHDDHESDIKKLLLVIEDHMKRATFPSPEISAGETNQMGLGDQLKTLKDEPQLRFIGVMEHFIGTITKLSRQLASKPGHDPNGRTIEIIGALSHHSWKTIVALALAAFSINYGKIRLLTLRFTSNQLARNVALLKQQSSVLVLPKQQSYVPEYPPILKIWFNALGRLLYEMLELTKRIVDFEEPTQAIGPEFPDKSIEDAAYWTIFSVVVCSSQIMDVLIMRRGNPAECHCHLATLSNKLKSRLGGNAKRPQASRQRSAVGETVPGEIFCPPGKILLTSIKRLCSWGTPLRSDRHTIAYQTLHSKPEIHLLASSFDVGRKNVLVNSALPLTQLGEEMLRKSEPREIDFLVDSIDPMLSNLIAENRYICLYGGEDKEWIRRFTSSAREVASIANLPLEMFYMGRSCPTDVTESNISTIVSENLSHWIEDLNLIRFFWHRLESIIKSRLCIESAENDSLTRDIKNLLNFGKDGKSWALISRKESRIMCLGNGEDVLKGFMEYNKWKDDAADLGFLPALHNYLHEMQNPRTSNDPKSPDVSPGTQHRSKFSNFLWRSSSCFAHLPAK